MSRDAIVSTAIAYKHIAGGKNFDEYRGFMYRRDTVDSAKSFVYGHPNAKPRPILPQSGCAVFASAVADTAEVDGKISWRGRLLDIFGVPYLAVNGLAPALLEELGRQRGLLHDGLSDTSKPDLSPATFLAIGGDDGLPAEQRVWGGPLHVIVVTGEDGETVEGGQPDPLNGYGLSAVLLKHREMYLRGKHYWVRTAGTQEIGRRVRWWFDAGALPCRSAA